MVSGRRMASIFSSLYNYSSWTSLARGAKARGTVTSVSLSSNTYETSKTDCLTLTEPLIFTKLLGEGGGTVVEMNTRSSARPGWVWASLALQFVVAAVSAWAIVALLGSWTKYTAPGVHFDLAIRVFVPAVLVAASLLGLWRSERWGWAWRCSRTVSCVLRIFGFFSTMEALHFSICAGLNMMSWILLR